jgi:hypothetical protein
MKIKKKDRAHVDYEFKMLEWASAHIDSDDAFRTQVQQNAILECFLLHASNLYGRIWNVSYALDHTIFGEDVIHHANVFLTTLSYDRSKIERPDTFSQHKRIVKELKRLYDR